MNNNHVPSVELCKKLKDIGCTRKSRWQEDILYFREDEEDEYRIISKEVYDNVYGSDFFDAFSVMELLDILRLDRRNVALRKFTEQEDCERMGKKPKTLPDYLAEFLIWDMENGYCKI